MEGQSCCASCCATHSPPSAQQRTARPCIRRAPMNPVTQLPSSQSLTIQPLRPSELANAAQQQLSWLWHGYLAPGKVTTLISPPKSGKTPLASHLLARFAAGGQLA